MMTPSSYDYVSAIAVEVALEGLDGITLEALLTRLRNRKPQPLFEKKTEKEEENSRAKQILFEVTKDLSEIRFHLLENGRKALVIEDRYNEKENLN